MKSWSEAYPNRLNATCVIGGFRASALQLRRVIHAMAAKKAGAQANRHHEHLAANLAESHEMSKKQTEAVLGDLVGLVTKHLKKGDRHPYRRLGILVVRSARPHGPQPRDREPIQIKASKKVAFRPAKEIERKQSELG